MKIDNYHQSFYKYINFRWENCENIRAAVFDFLKDIDSIEIVDQASNYLFLDDKAPYGFDELFNTFHIEDGRWMDLGYGLVDTKNNVLVFITIMGRYKSRYYEVLLSVDLIAKAAKCHQIQYRGNENDDSFYEPKFKILKDYKECNRAEVELVTWKVKYSFKTVLEFTNLQNGIVPSKKKNIEIKVPTNILEKETWIPEIVQYCIGEKNSPMAFEYFKYVIDHYNDKDFDYKNALFESCSFDLKGDYIIKEVLIECDKNAPLSKVKNSITLKYISVLYNNEQSYFKYEKNVGFKNQSFTKYEEQYTSYNLLTSTYNINDAIEEYFETELKKLKGVEEEKKQKEKVGRIVRQIKLSTCGIEYLAQYICSAIENYNELSELGHSFLFHPHQVPLSNNNRFKYLEIEYDGDNFNIDPQVIITKIYIVDQGKNMIFDYYDKENDYYRVNKGETITSPATLLKESDKEFESINRYINNKYHELHIEGLTKDIKYQHFYKTKDELEAQEKEEKEAIKEVKVEEVKKVEPTIYLRKDKIEEFKTKVSNIIDSKDKDKNYPPIIEFYNNELNELEKKEEDVKEYYALLCSSYDEYLMGPNVQNILKTSKDKIRNVYGSDHYYRHLNEFLKKKPEYREHVRKILNHLMTDSFNELCAFFNASWLNITHSYKKIRVINSELPRIIFLWGDNFEDSARKEKGAIYLVDFLSNEDHDYDFLKNQDYSKDNYRMEFGETSLYEPTEKQKVYIENNQYPFLCMGVAGAGKSTIAVYKYKQIINNYFDKINVDIHDLVYLTFNDRVRDYATNQLRCMNIESPNTESINSFFDVVLSVRHDNIQTLQDFNNWLKEEYLVSKSSSKRKYINTIIKKKEFVNFVYTYYRGVFKGGMCDWSRSDFTKPLEPFDTFKKYLSQNGKDKYLTDDDASALWDVCKEYNDYLKKNNLMDENDLAYAVINKLKKEKGVMKFDHIIVDEVQDLTEVQLYAILLMSKDFKVYFFGDQNQTINPTVFDVNKIRGALMKASGDSNLIIKNKESNIELNKTFRSGYHLLEYINKLIDLRKECLGSSKFDGHIECYNKEDKDKYWARCIFEPKLIDYALKASSNNSSCIVLVNNEEQKQDVIKKYPSIEGNVWTIYEAKGLEKETVILYNFLGYEEDYYKEILTGNYVCSLLHKMIFNRYYVACTRAIKTFLVIEDNLDSTIKDKMLKGIESVKSKSGINTFISKTENPEDWYANGKEYFELGYYIQAKRMFDKALSYNKKDNSFMKDIIDMNNHLIDVMNGKNGDISIANKMYSKGYYRQAKFIYEKIGRTINVLECKIQLGEYLLQEEVMQVLDSSEVSSDCINKLLKSSFVTNLVEDIKNLRKVIKGE